MKKYSQTEIQKVEKVVASIISNFKKSQLKCEGTFEFVLLKRWIQALEISKSLLENNEEMLSYSTTDLEAAKQRINSIIRTTEIIRDRYEEESVPYQKYTQTLKAMHISKSFIENVLSPNRKDNPYLSSGVQNPPSYMRKVI